MESMEVAQANGKRNTKQADFNKSLYVGNLHGDTTEALLCAVFEQFGKVVSCRILNDGTKPDEKYAFVEYNDHEAAALAIGTMTGRVLLGKTIKVNWARKLKGTENVMEGEHEDNSNHYHIFIGDLDSAVTEEELQQAFFHCGKISGCRIIRDPMTQNSRNYGFISFAKKDEAENAIATMNGVWIRNRSIRTNWAQRKMMEDNTAFLQTKPKYHQVDKLTGPRNTTIFVGNITDGLTESLLESLFNRFGIIASTRVFPDKGFGFVNFVSKPSAIKAIIEMNLVKVNGKTITVSWGRRERSISENDIMGSMGGFGNNSFSSAYHGYGGVGGQYFHPPSMNEYWHQMQNYQQVCAMFAQQQHFYQTNAPSASVYPYYAGSSNGQTPPIAPSGLSQTQMQRQQNASDRSNVRNKPQTYA